MDRDFWEQFIDVYRSHPCLWNSQSVQYSCKVLREEAYDDLILKCKELYPTADKEFVLKKIHSLRCTFRREHRKVLAYQSRGVPYTPALWNYGIMAFIADESAEENEKVFNVSKSAQKKMREEQNEKAVCDSLEEEYLDFTELESSQESDSSLKADIPTNGNHVKRKMHSSIKSTKRKPSPIVNTLDACDVAGNQFAVDLRSLDPDQRKFAEKIINRVICYAKLKKLGDDFSFNLGNATQEEK